ncbi:MAG: hypothetical protein ACR2J8_01480 [Thermomicrobiales bacterium]
MRWFIAWIFTAMMTFLASALVLTLDVLSSREVDWATTAREALSLPVPGFLARFAVPVLIVLAQVGCWLLARIVLLRVFAYVNSEMVSSPRSALGDEEASLRPRDRRRRLRGRTAIRFFHNPRGGWMLLYVMALNMLVWAVAPLEFNVPYWYLPPIPIPVWGLCMLYAATVTLAMLTPDKPLSVRRLDDLGKLPTDDEAEPARDGRGAAPGAA